jgi:hypothetical protein
MLANPSDSIGFATSLRGGPRERCLTTTSWWIHRTRRVFCLLAVIYFTAVCHVRAANLFELPPNDPVRLLTRAVGILTFYSNEPERKNLGGEVGSCVAAVVSEKYIVASADCGRAKDWFKKWPIVRADLRLGFDGWSKENGQVTHRSYLDKAFNVKLDPIYMGTNYSFLEVQGNPAKTFGTIKLVDRDPISGEALLSISGLAWLTNTDCVVSAAPPGQSDFTYTCDDDPINKTFLISKDGLGIIGIPYAPTQSAKKHAISIRRFIRDPDNSVHLSIGEKISSPRSKELPTQKQFWQEQVFLCQSGDASYPAKNDKPYDPLRRYDPKIPKSVWQSDYLSTSDCDDGDMIFFDGLLCAAGEKRACKGIAISQDETTGKWWRSKRLKLERQTDTADQASFSTEQGLGVLNYMIKTADKKAFEFWLDWIGAVAHTYGPFPSYCEHKECVFKIVDCPLLVTVASRFGDTAKALSVCDPLRYLHLPTPDQFAQQLSERLDQLLAGLGRYETQLAQFIDKMGGALGFPTIESVLPLPIEVLRNQNELAVSAFRKVFEDLLGPKIGEAAAQFAQQIVLVNSVVNSIDMDGFKINTKGKITYDSAGVHIEGASVTTTGKIEYNPNGEHIAAVEIFALRNLGYQSEELTKAAFYAHQRDEANPFFEYLWNGRSARLLDLTLEKCPSKDRPSLSRFQWFPERGEEAQQKRNNLPAWTESMYWDCIFLASLYASPLTSSLSGSSPQINPFAGLGGPMEDIQKLLASLLDLKNQVENRVNEMRNKLKSDFCNHNSDDPVCKTIDSLGVELPGGVIVEPHPGPPEKPQDVLTPGFQVR